MQDARHQMHNTPAGTFTCYEYTVKRSGDTQVWCLSPGTGFVKLVDRGESQVISRYSLY